MNIGCKVTLRKDRMYEFVDRLITIALQELEILKDYPRRVLMVMEITL